MIYLYAIADDHSVDLTGIRGLGGASVEGIPLGPILAITSQHDRPAFEADEDSLWAHQTVLDAVMQQSAVVPARFGTVVRDPEDLRRLLGPRLTRLQELLGGLRGRCELALRATIPNPSPGENAALHQVLNTLSSMSVASATGPAGDGSTTVSYLVESDQVDRFADAVSCLSQTCPSVVMSLTGPWAPFSFVNEPHPAGMGAERACG